MCILKHSTFFIHQATMVKDPNTTQSHLFSTQKFHHDSHFYKITIEEVKNF